MNYQRYHLNWIDPKKSDMDKLTVEWPGEADVSEEVAATFFWTKSDIQDDVKRYKKYLETEMHKLMREERENLLKPHVPNSDFEMDVKIYQVMVELPLNDFTVSMTDLLTPYSRERFVKLWEAGSESLYQLMKKLGPLRFYLKMKKEVLKTKQAKRKNNPLLVDDLTGYQRYFWPNQQTVDTVFNAYSSG